MALDTVNIINDDISGIRMEPSLLLHHPTNGENIICPKGLAATTQPINSLPAVGSNCKQIQNLIDYFQC